MSRELLMIVFVTLSTLASQLLVKYAVTDIAARSPGLKGMPWLFAAVTSPAVIAAVLVQALGFVVWVIVVSRVKLGVAFALSGAFFYLLMALSGWWLFGERLAPVQWVGIVLLTIGVLCVSQFGRP